MRSALLTSISRIGFLLPIDLGLSHPLTLSPVLFYKTKDGSFLRDSFLRQKLGEFLYSYEDAKLPGFTPVFSDGFFSEFVDHHFHLVFVRQEYDGSSLYYLCHDLSPQELIKFSKLFKETKGGIFL